jgi:hypothetical protein
MCVLLVSCCRVWQPPDLIVGRRQLLLAGKCRLRAIAVLLNPAAKRHAEAIHVAAGLTSAGPINPAPVS